LTGGVGGDSATLFFLFFSFFSLSLSLSNYKMVGVGVVAVLPPVLWLIYGMYHCGLEEWLGCVWQQILNF